MKLVVVSKVVSPVESRFYCSGATHTKALEILRASAQLFGNDQFIIDGVEISVSQDEETDGVELIFDLKNGDLRQRERVWDRVSEMF